MDLTSLILRTDRLWIWDKNMYYKFWISFCCHNWDHCVFTQVCFLFIWHKVRSFVLNVILTHMWPPEISHIKVVLHLTHTNLPIVPFIPGTKQSRNSEVLGDGAVIRKRFLRPWLVLRKCLMISLKLLPAIVWIQPAELGSQRRHERGQCWDNWCLLKSAECPTMKRTPPSFPSEIKERSHQALYTMQPQHQVKFSRQTRCLDLGAKVK